MATTAPAAAIHLIAHHSVNVNGKIAAPLTPESVVKMRLFPLILGWAPKVNNIMAAIVICSLLAFPPAILITKFITRKPGWWLIVLLLVLFSLLGWGVVITGYVEEQARISELIDQKRYEELPEGWDSDGASGLFAVFGGWLVPLAYFVLWLAPYTLAAMIRRRPRIAEVGMKSECAHRPPIARLFR